MAGERREVLTLWPFHLGDHLPLALVFLPARDTVCQPVIDTANGGVDGRVRGVDADPMLAQAEQRLLLRIGERERLQWTEDDGVVGDNHGRAELDCLVDDGARQVDGEEDDVLRRPSDVGTVRGLKQDCTPRGQQGLAWAVLTGQEEGRTARVVPRLVGERKRVPWGSVCQPRRGCCPQRREAPHSFWTAPTTVRTAGERSGLSAILHTSHWLRG